MSDPGNIDRPDPIAPQTYGPPPASASDPSFVPAWNGPTPQPKKTPPILLAGALAVVLVIAVVFGALYISESSAHRTATRNLHDTQATLTAKQGELNDTQGKLDDANGQVASLKGQVDLLTKVNTDLTSCTSAAKAEISALKAEVSNPSDANNSAGLTALEAFESACK